MSMAVLFGVTYASNSSDTPIHVLNYETGRLYWAHRSDRIDENGVYQLSLFDTLPTGEDGEKIISPGDSYKNTVELRNQTGHEVTYTAVLYMVSNDNVPIISDISNIPAENDTTFYSLPDGVKSTDVVRAVEGKLGAFGIQSFEMDWKWEFSTGADGDAIDTALGNLEYSGVKMGIWIVVSDNTTAEPEPSPENTNIDIDGDGIPDVNIDTDGDGKAELNIDTDGDKVPDINVDKDKDGYPDISIDINGDGITDFNVDTDRDGIADDYIVEITIVDGVVIIPPKTFEAMMKLPEVVDSMTLKLDNFGRGIIGVDFPKQELNDFVTGGGRIHVVMTSIEVEAETSTLQSFIDASKDTNVRLIVREMLPSELTETELSNVERNRLMLALEAYAMSGTQIIRDIPSAPLKISVPFKAVEGTGKEDTRSIP